MAFFDNKPATKSGGSGPAKGAHIDTLFGEQARFTGDLDFEGTVRIDGRFDGNIVSQKSGVLIVSETAKVTGDVTVPDLVVHGMIAGNVHTSQSLLVGPKGEINGDVSYSLINVEEGGNINGRLAHATEKKGAAAAKTESAATNAATKPNNNPTAK